MISGGVDSHPNSCPRCGSTPYPSGIQCSCGYIGEGRKAREDEPASIGFILVALLILFVLVFGSTALYVFVLT